MTTNLLAKKVIPLLSGAKKTIVRHPLHGHTSQFTLLEDIPNRNSYISLTK